MISDGVISFVPSQAKPPQGFANVCDEIPAWYVPGAITPKSNAAVVGRGRRLHDLVARVAELHGHARQAELALLDLARGRRRRA